MYIFALGFKQGFYYQEEFQAHRKFIRLNELGGYSKGVALDVREFYPSIFAVEKLHMYQVVTLVQFFQAFYNLAS